MGKISDTPTIHEQAYDRIRHMIMSGKIAAGHKIVENDLVKRLGTSRGPIRESLMRLMAEGLVVSEPRRGFKVKSFTVNEIVEHYEARELIERLTSRLAAERANPEQIAKCEKSVYAYKELYEKKRRASDSVTVRLISNKMILLDKDFHFQIWQMCGNRKIKQLCSDIFDEMVCMRIDNISKAVYDDIELRESETLQDHYDVLNAIKCHEAGVAEDAMRKHISKAADYFSSHPGLSINGVKSLEKSVLSRAIVDNLDNPARGKIDKGMIASA